MFTIIITLKIAISMVNMSVKISNVECEENEDCTKACPDEEGRCIPHCVISPTGGKCTYGNLIIANLDEILEVEEDNRKDTDKEDQSEENDQDYMDLNEPALSKKDHGKFTGITDSNLQDNKKEETCKDADCTPTHNKSDIQNTMNIKGQQLIVPPSKHRRRPPSMHPKRINAIARKLLSNVRELMNIQQPLQRQSGKHVRVKAQKRPILSKDSRAKNKIKRTGKSVSG